MTGMLLNHKQYLLISSFLWAVAFLVALGSLGTRGIRISEHKLCCHALMRK